MKATDYLVAYITDVWLGGDGEGFASDTPLLDLNIISSAEVFDLVHAIQKAFGVSIPLSYIKPENFRSVDVIADLIDRLEKKPEDAR